MLNNLFKLNNHLAHVLRVDQWPQGRFDNESITYGLNYSIEYSMSLSILTVTQVVLHTSQTFKTISNRNKLATNCGKKCNK